MAQNHEKEIDKTTSKRVITLEIHLRKDQIERAQEIFDLSSHIWNIFMGANMKMSAQVRDIYTPNEFDTEYYQKILRPSNPEYWDRLPSKCRQETLRRCFKTMKLDDDPDKCQFYFRGKNDRNKDSFFFIKNGVRLLDSKHLWIPVLHSIKLKEEWKELVPIANVTSGRIMHNKRLDKWYVCLTADVKLDYGRKDNPNELIKHAPPMGITFGLNRYFTVYCEGIQDELFTRDIMPLTDENLAKIDNEIIQLTQYMNHKIMVNKVRHGYAKDTPDSQIPEELHDEIFTSCRIRKLQDKINKLYERAKNYRAYVRKNICSALVRHHPVCICIDDTDSIKLAERQWESKNPSAVYRSCISISHYLFIRELKWQCLKYNIPVYEPKPFYSWEKRQAIMNDPNLWNSTVDIDRIIASANVDYYLGLIHQTREPENYAAVARPR